MEYKVKQLVCPSCGFPVELGMTECPAGHPIYFSSFEPVCGMPPQVVKRYANLYESAMPCALENSNLCVSAGFCYLKLKLYEKAFDAFESATDLNPDNAEAYFYAAVATLKGKRAFLAPRADIDRAISLVNAAISVEPRGIYYYFLAYIKYDYFERKYLNTSPNRFDCLLLALELGTTQEEISLFCETLGIERPFEV